jgi:transposase
MPPHTELELKLIKENDELKHRIAVLEARLRVYDNPHTPSSKQRFKRKPKEPNGKLGAPLGHSKWEREQPEPTKTVEHSEDACPHCKHKLGKPFKTDRRVIEEIPKPRPIEVVEHLVNYYHCRHCGKHVIAKNNLPKGMFGPNAEALTILFRFDDRLPLRKTVNALARFGLDMTNVRVQNISQRTAHRLLPEYNKHIKLLRASRVVYADETDYKINGITYWLWSFTTEHQTVYVIRKQRNANVPLEILGKTYEGIITSDGHTAYRKIGSGQQRCWSHILTDSKDLAKNFGKEAKYVHTQLKKIFAEAKTFNHNGTEKDIEQLKKKIFLITQRHYKNHFVWRFTQNLYKRDINNLFLFVTTPDVEPTNNISERELRKIVIIRKISNGSRSKQGADNTATLLSILQTLKNNKQNLFQQLQQLANTSQS